MEFVFLKKNFSVSGVPIQQNLQRHNIHEREFSFYHQLKTAKQKSPKSDFKKIVGGTDAAAGEYPFQVTLNFSISIINKKLLYLHFLKVNQRRDGDRIYTENLQAEMTRYKVM